MTELQDMACRKIDRWKNDFNRSEEQILQMMEEQKDLYGDLSGLNQAIYEEVKK